MSKLEQIPGEPDIAAIENHLAKSTLLTRRNQKVKFVNLVTDINYVLVSLEDTKAKNSEISKNFIKISDFPQLILLPQLKNELMNPSLNEFINYFEELKKKMLTKFFEIEQHIVDMAGGHVMNFIKQFKNNLLHENTAFTAKFEELITKLSKSTSYIHYKVEPFQRVVDKMIDQFYNLVGLSKNEIFNFRSVKEESNNNCRLPRSLHKKQQIIINSGIPVPLNNGIDIHPTKNIFIAMGEEGGDIVVVDQDTNKEFTRIKLDSSGGSVQSCLFNSTGTQFMLSTMMDHKIEIFDTNEYKLFRSIEINYSKISYGAVWLSESDIAIGYSDGTIKIINIINENEVGNIKLYGRYAWGMDYLNESHFVAGDDSGSIYCINWRHNSFEWVKNDWHSENCRCLKLNNQKNLLLTGGDDKFVRVMKVGNQSKHIEFELDSSINGLSWLDENAFAIAMDSTNQLVVLDINKRTKLFQFNDTSLNLCSMRFNLKKEEILIGDSQGNVKILKLLYEDSKLKQQKQESYAKIGQETMEILIKISIKIFKKQKELQL